MSLRSDTGWEEGDSRWLCCRGNFEPTEHWQANPEQNPAAHDYVPVCSANSIMLIATTSKSPGLALSGTPTGPPPNSFGR